MLSKSSLMAVGVAAAAAVWMLSGLVGARAPSADDAAASGAAASSGPAARGEGHAPAASGAGAGYTPKAEQAATGVRVAVRRSVAEPVVRNVVVSGRTEPNRVVEIKAETEGRVVEIGVERGRPIAEGERIVSLDERERNARLEEAEALLAHRELQYEAAKALEGRQLAAEVQIAEANAQLVSARAALEQIRLDLERTKIAAPFDGVLEDRSVEIGDYVGIGDPIAQVADNDPLIAVGELSEREIGKVSIGGAGRAQLVDGEVAEGTIRYISPVADPNTRTFRIELAIPNPDHAMPAGMTAELRLPAAEIEAHFLSPALLTLDDDGNIGVKAVDETHKVRFHEVQIVRSANDGVWVTGLPDDVLIITVGQGFVAIGETVQPVHE
ncbi:MAG: efflux RND transporter periplasmic adaptor subunit [Gammaproteobacteria bacterium]|nr:efflux RND transporter periplasmic adaptor subunit [Gammaproteobacteria bacterium]